jgi:hypothetical protein
VFDGDKRRTRLGKEMVRAEFGRERFWLFEREFGGDRLVDDVEN